jgi:hypothetical protein
MKKHRLEHVVSVRITKEQLKDVAAIAKAEERTLAFIVRRLFLRGLSAETHFVVGKL